MEESRELVFDLTSRELAHTRKRHRHFEQLSLIFKRIVVIDVTAGVLQIILLVEVRHFCDSCKRQISELRLDPFRCCVLDSETMPEGIEYSERYYDESFEYRHVTIPKSMAEKLRYRVLREVPIFRTP